MNKQQEALHLALEALEECRRDPRLKYEHPYYDKTITAIRAALASKSEALAEQPAQQQEPCGWRMKHNGEWAYSFTADAWDFIRRIPKAQQQEPVAWRTKNATPPGGYVLFQQYPQAVAEHEDEIESLYTSPPTSKPWVGLTDEEMRDLEKQFNAERVRTSDEEYLIIYPGDYWAWQRAIEAKLREKNA